MYSVHIARLRTTTPCALAQIEREGKGVLLYMRQEGRGIGFNKLRAYKLQEEGFDTVEANEKLGFPADLRDYGIGAQILKDLGLQSLRLLTNNPKNCWLTRLRFRSSRACTVANAGKEENKSYLQTKVNKLGHLLNL